MVETPITWSSYSDGVLKQTPTGTWRTAHKKHGFGAWPVYHRHVSNEYFMPPYTLTGRVFVRKRLSDVVIESENRIPTWDWGFCIFPIHVDNDNNLVARFWNESQRLTLSQEINHTYSKIDSYMKVPTPSYGEWHTFRFDVHSFDNYSLYWNSRLLKSWSFPGVNNILRQPVQIGFRCDFFDVEFDNIVVTQRGQADMYEIVNPKRVLDTRPNRPEPSETLTIKTGAPVGAVAAHVVLTAVDAKGPGWFAAWAQGKMPNSSVLNTSTKGETVANAVNVPLDAKGQFKVFTSSGDHLIADVMGFYR